jgi:hypothetical protein
MFWLTVFKSFRPTSAFNNMWSNFGRAKVLIALIFWTVRHYLGFISMLNAELGCHYCSLSIVHRDTSIAIQSRAAMWNIDRSDRRLIVDLDEEASVEEPRVRREVRECHSLTDYKMILIINCRPMRNLVIGLRTRSIDRAQPCSPFPKNKSLIVFMVWTIPSTQWWSMNKATPWHPSLSLALSVFTEEYCHPMNVHYP